METQTFRYAAAALITTCFVSVAAAQSPALNDLLGASKSIPSQFSEVSYPVDTNTGDEFSYIDPSHIVPAEPLQSALAYYKAHRNRIENPKYLSVIDFTQRADNKRYYLINMRTGAVERFLVAHGSGSDPARTGYATRFSNEERTHASSLGFYKTAETYEGEHGYSLRLDGLSSTNSNAREREIVIHGAEYVSELGRSWGCPAIEPSQRERLISMVKGGSIIYAYNQRFSNPANEISDDVQYAYQSAPRPAAALSEAEEPKSISVAQLPDDQAFMVRQPAEKDPEAQYFEPSRLDNKGSLPDSIPYLDIILRVSREKGVDPALVLAVIQQESGFNPKARSSAGALGLMQVMPATARSMGLRDTRQLLNPEVNIKYGVQYIKDLWAQFGDKDLSLISAGDINRSDIVNIIAAYNAGPGNVQKYHGVPPFRETRNYLVSVSANFARYKDLAVA